MLETVKDTIARYEMLRGGETVLCAVSGGADSVAMLRALLELRERLGVTVRACHLNHLLRGAESDRDEAFVCALCEALRVPLDVQRRDVAAFAAAQGLGVEEAARDVRYRVLREAASRCGAERIALAHTLDDNLETMLFHLARGAGTQGLAGIPPVRGALIRPLIGTSRAEVEGYLYALHQRYVNDSSNDSADFTRNRIRREVVPVLREINPRCAEAAGRAARLLRKDEEYLQAQADALRVDMTRRDAEGLHLGCAAFAAAPDALRGRILRGALREVGMPMAECTIALVRRLTALACGDGAGGELSLPGGLVAVRQYGDLLLGAAPAPVSACEIALRPGCRVPLWQNGVVLTVSEAQNGVDFNKTFNTFTVDCGKIDLGTLCARPRRTGDTVRLNAGGGHRTLKRLMIDRRIPRLTRDRLAVVADKDGVIAVQDIGANWDRRPGGGPVIQIRFEGENRV